ncbi:IclR family transcriptional regulator [Paracoccus sp. (in: a-proteobacteria)]|uniref:IclR family transcriptional regulator n=1 Tax=Paracoccus sp. TaxID=267 RepID=UPI0032204C80
MDQTTRAVLALECLAEAPPAGVALGDFAAALDLPKSGAHRLLAALIAAGYAGQDAASGFYRLTPRLVALALRHLGRQGVVDAAQPVLDRLAALSGELVRLSVSDGERQVWVAKAQGARHGLIYDPQMGTSPHLASMATGQAFLASMADDRALRLVAAQGLQAEGAGPNAPRDLPALVARLAEVRAAGHALVSDSSAPGMSAIARVIRHSVDGHVIGTVSIGGPATRLTRERMQELAPALADAAAELSDCAAGSAAFSPARH